MTRFLITCWPFAGHLHGQLAVAGALRDRGHDVAVWTGPSAAAAVERAGATLVPFEHLDEEAVHAPIRRLEGRDHRRPPDPRMLRGVLRDWLVGTLPGQLADLGPLVERWQPDVIVTDPAVWAPIVVLGEATGRPVAVSCPFLGPLLPGPDAPVAGLGLAPPRGPLTRAAHRLLDRAVERAGAGMRAEIDRRRAGHGLAPLPTGVNRFTGRLPLYLVHSVPGLDHDRHDLPAAVRWVGPCPWFPEPRPGGLDVPAGRPWVHVSEGTLHTGDPFLSRAAAHGLAGGDHEVIITTGGRDPAALDLGPRAANVHLTPWINHDDLLPRCSAVVTAGGAGTIRAAVAAGVPLVVVPTTWDKPDNARRVTAAGVGVRLAPRRCTPARLRAAVDEVLTDPSYRAAARRLAAEMAAAPGAAGAAELLEALAPVTA